MKSERLKKLENELKDLQQWLDLGLVPKKDIAKHKVEMNSLQKKIEDEINRLLELKEGGEIEGYSAPKRGGARPVYQEPQTLPGVDAESGGMTDAGFDIETTTYESETTHAGTEETSEEPTIVEEDEEDPFSDKNRWKRGILEDPDSDNW